MSKFQEYHTIYLEAAEVEKEFPGENKNPGWYDLRTCRGI